jgi:bifunctional non-homologous end joining protein LigD
MLAKPGPLPSGPGWSYEVKWDGFRALVSTVDGLKVRSRRGWNMTEALPELRGLPAGLVLDGELVAFNQAGDPHFPLPSKRILNRDTSVPIQFMIFDVLEVDGESHTASSFARRRDRLEQLGLDGPAWMTPDTFDDGHALYNAVCERGLEGIVAKWRRASYRPGQRGWIKVKNPAYWRRDSEFAAMSRSA